MKVYHKLKFNKHEEIALLIISSTNVIHKIDL